MVNASVPVTAPVDVVLTGIENVVADSSVAVRVPFTVAQDPVPPDIVTFGRELVSSPWPAVTVKTTGEALVAESIAMDSDVG